jgi:hypothetical protein
MARLRVEVSFVHVPDGMTMDVLLVARRSIMRVFLIVVAACAFGLLAALVKGAGGDGVGTLPTLRIAVTDLSAPWLLVAFLAGRRATRLAAGALLGFLATMSALLGFYLLVSLVLAADLGGDGILGNAGQTLWANRIYLAGGVLTGPLCGALGARWRATRTGSVALVAGVLLAGEPLVLTGIGVLLPATVVGRDAIRIAVFVAEFATGILLVLLWLARSARTPDDTRDAAPPPISTTA